jgi:hypothetical protein
VGQHFRDYESPALTTELQPLNWSIYLIVIASVLPFAQ